MPASALVPVPAPSAHDPMHAYGYTGSPNARSDAVSLGMCFPLVNVSGGTVRLWRATFQGRRRRSDKFSGSAGADPQVHVELVKDMLVGGFQVRFSSTGQQYSRMCSLNCAVHITVPIQTRPRLDWAIWYVRSFEHSSVPTHLSRQLQRKEHLA